MDVQEQAENSLEDQDYLDHDLPEVEDHPDGEKEEAPEGEEASTEEESGEDDFVIEGLEAAPASAEHETPLIREMRARLREEAKERKRLEREKQELERKIAPVQEAPDVLPQKPTLESVGYDEELYQQSLDVWYETKARADAQKRQQEAAQQAAQAEFEGIITGHRAKAAALKKADYEDMAELVSSNLNTTQQEFIIRGADDSAKLVYALGKYPAKLKELAAIKDPAKFAFAVAKLETQLKTTKKTTVQPEKTLSPVASGTASSSSLDRLREQAQKTGDYSAYMAAKRKQAAKK